MRRFEILCLVLAAVQLVGLAGCGANSPESILTDPVESFLCQAADLPTEGDYRVPEAGMVFRQSNEMILANASDSDREYLDVTGRLDGWVAQYQRNNEEASLPGLIFCSSVMYATAQGARVSVLYYNSAVRETPGWVQDEASGRLGDESVLLTFRSQDVNELRIWKVLEFAYHNVVIDVGGLGLESELETDDLRAIGRAILDRLEEGTLATPTAVLPMP